MGDNLSSNDVSARVQGENVLGDGVNLALDLITS